MGRRKIEVEELKKAIINALNKAYPDDLTQAAIAAKVGIHRNTIGKYLEMLRKEGNLKTRKIGKYMLYRVAK